MPDPKTKLPENRMHLFDPVGLINDGYGTSYWSSNHAIRPQRPTKSCDIINDTNNNIAIQQGLKSSHEKSLSETNSRVGLLSFDSLTHTNSFTIDDVNDLNVGEIRLQVKTITTVDQQDESDVSTPKFWKPNSPASPKSMINSPPLNPASPESVNSSPLQGVSPRSTSAVTPTLSGEYHNNQYQTMSPSSRTQAIAKGRKELMEMVRDLPESFYELSLKDLVEKKPELEIPKEVYLQSQSEEKKEDKELITKAKKKKKKKSKKKVKKSESKKKMVRSRSVDNGRFLLRTLVVFPIFSRSKKGKKKVGRSSSLKVAPMPKPPQPPTTTSGSMKGVHDKDWWRRRSCISSESDESNVLSISSVSSESSSSSSNSRSNSNNTRQNKRFLSSCCFFNGRKVEGKK